MRCIQVFVLRLLFDSDTPQALRGSIHAVSDGELHYFADATTLLELVTRLSQAALQAQTKEQDQTEVENEQPGT